MRPPAVSIYIRRHSSPSWLSLITVEAPVVRGRKLVVQLVETFRKGGVPALVESLDAVEVGKQSGMPIAPVMIYGDDVSHVVTEEGIAYLYKAQGQEETGSQSYVPPDPKDDKALKMADDLLRGTIVNADFPANPKT